MTEAEQLLADGAQEMDLMINVGINVQASMDMITACAELPGGVLRV